MFSAPLLPGRGWTLPEPSARSSLLASRLPRHSHSPSHGPEPARTFGCRLCRAPRKDAPKAPREPSSRWGRVENHNLPLHGAASHTETVPAISPHPSGPETPPGDTREASAPALLGSSSLLGQGVGVGMDAVVVGAAVGTVSRAPSSRPSPGEAAPCLAREGQAPRAFSERIPGLLQLLSFLSGRARGRSQRASATGCDLLHEEGLGSDGCCAACLVPGAEQGLQGAAAPRGRTRGTS